MVDKTVEPSSPGRRAAAYWFIDGLPQIVLGLAILFSAFLGILVRVLLASEPQFFHVLITASGFQLYASFGRRTIEGIKARVTYPRTGYAEAPEEVPGKESIGLTSLNLNPHLRTRENVTSFLTRTGLVILFALWMPFGGAPRCFVPALLAALAAVLYFFNGKTVHPYTWRAVVALPAISAPFFFMDAPPPVQEWLPLLLTGLWLTALGALQLIRYLRANSIADSTERHA